VTEAEWLAYTDPLPMLRFLRGRVSERKLRLYACGCCRLVWELLSEGSRGAVEIAERYADHQATDVERDEAERSVAGSGQSILFAEGGESLTIQFSRHLAASMSRGATVPGRLLWETLLRVEEPPQLSEEVILKDLFGTLLFRPIPPDPVWQGGNIQALARIIYDERRSDLLPLLADLLEEAGCPAEVSDHCRGPGPHVRGCWVVDLVLGLS
jgi:hypothetical protein